MGIHIWQLNLCKVPFLQEYMNGGDSQPWSLRSEQSCINCNGKKILRQSSNANLLQRWTLGSLPLFSLPYMRIMNNLLFYPWKSSAACIFKSIKHATLQQWGTKRKQRVDYLFSLQMLQYKLGVVHYTTSYHIDSSCISIGICTDFIYFIYIITWAYIFFPQSCTCLNYLCWLTGSKLVRRLDAGSSDWNRSIIRYPAVTMCLNFSLGFWPAESSAVVFSCGRGFSRAHGQGQRRSICRGWS